MKTLPTDRCLHVYKRAGHYPSPWKTGRIQKVMIKWADNLCENCGASGTDALLHVHHIAWEAKHDCRFENLVVVCVGCHVRIHNHHWQPGRPWTLTSTPDWMTLRGYENPLPVSLLSSTDSDIQEAIDSFEKHIKVSVALQKQALECLSEARQSVLPESVQLLRSATQSFREAIKLERESRKALLSVKRMLT